MGKYHCSPDFVRLFFFWGGQDFCFQSPHAFREPENEASMKGGWQSVPGMQVVLNVSLESG